MSLLSTSLIYGIDKSTLGIFTPLWLDTGPPHITSHTTSVSVTSNTFNSINPSSISILVPTSTSLGSPLYVTEAISELPINSLVVRVNLSPFSNIIFPSSKSLTLTSGPFVSSMAAIGRPNSFLNFLTLSNLPLCSSCVP